MIPTDEIVETYLNGNISDAREAILKGGGRYSHYTHSDVDVAVCVLDVLEELIGWDESTVPILLRLRNCLAGD